MIRLSSKQLDLAQIATSGQCFRMNAQDGGYMLTAGERRVFAMQKEGAISLDCEQSEEAFWRGYFDMDTDYGAILNAVDPNDEYLSRAAAFGSGIRILRQDLWEMIVTFLISQQNNIPRIKRCIENICKAYGAEMDGYYAFPKPEALAALEEDALLPCNLGYRSKYVVRTARQVTDRSFDLEGLKALSNAEAKEKLLKLYGVGEKVADCICLFALHHIDAFPVDTHIKSVLKKHYDSGFPFERYRGFAGILQQYIFYYDLNGQA